MGVELSGKVVDQAGDPKSGLTVSLYEAATWEAGGAATTTDTTDSDGLWNFDNQDITKTWLVDIADGTKHILIDARAEVQLTEIDIITQITVNTIGEHTAASGVTIDGVLLKDISVLTSSANYTSYTARSLSDTPGNRAVIKFERGMAGPATINASGFLLGELSWTGYDGAGYDDIAGVYVYSAEDFTATEHGAYMEFKTTTIGAASPSVKWTIENNGQLTNDGAGPLVMGAAYIEVTEMSAPGAGAANTARIYAEVGGDTLTDLSAVFQDGTVVDFAEEATAPDAPVMRYPDGTEVKTVLRKRHPGEWQIAAVFPDGTEWLLGNRTRYFKPEKIAMNKGAAGALPENWRRDG